MIVKEFYNTREDGVKLYRTYSDNGMQIRKAGTDEVYDDAVDVEGVEYVYEETGEAVEDATEVDYQNALRDMGVDV